MSKAKLIAQSEPVGLYPVSFVSIATESAIEDGSFANMVSSLPTNAEVNVLINRLSPDGVERLSDITEEREGNRVLRHQLWDYKQLHTIKHINDFAQARNYAHDMATQDWVMWMDTDEVLSPFFFDKIATMVTTLPTAAGVIMCGQVGISKVIVDADAPNAEAIYMNTRQPRIYRRSSGAKWERRIHEQVLQSILDNGYRYVESDIVIHHNGYAVSWATLLKKAERNMRLACQQLAEYDSSHPLYKDTAVLVLRESNAYQHLLTKGNN